MSFSNIISIVGLLMGLVAVWGTLSADNADTRRRVSTLEKQHEEQRQELKSTAQEIKADVKETKQDVQTILRKMETMEALQRRDFSERSRERR